MKARIPLSGRLACRWLTRRGMRRPTRELSPVWRGHAGAMPAPNPHGIVFAACDRRYFDRYALDYLASIRENSGKLSAHLHLYDGTDEQLEMVSELRRQHPGTPITASRDAHPAPDLYSPFFFAAGRFVRLAELLARTRSPIVCTDIDVRVRGDLQPFLAGLDGSDIGLYFRMRNTSPWRKILASTVVALPTDQACDFLARLACAMDAALRRRPRHHVDQLVLYYAYRTSLPEKLGPVRCAPLPQSVIDWELREDSLVWNFKGSARKSGMQRECRPAGWDSKGDSPLQRGSST